MALFENFPYTNLHNLNLDWIIDQINQVKESVVLSVNGQTGEVILYQNPWVRFPDVTTDDWTIVRNTDGVQRGIYFANDNRIYVMHGSTMSKIYTVSDPPPYPVTSVNGQTGNVVLYSDAQVRLPDLTDAQLTNWNLFRALNGVVRGIEFKDDGTAVVINGTTRDPVYTAGNPPPYPVTSVNGQTGAVTLVFPVTSVNGQTGDVSLSFPVTSVNGQTGDIILYQNANVELPTVSTGSSWQLYRTVNGNVMGLKFYNDGTSSIILNNDEYPIYIQGITEPSDFNDPEAAVLEIKDELTSGNTWGITREINNDNVGLVFVYDSVRQQYDTYMKVGNTTTKLLTNADIPSSSGVVSFNGQTGAVSVTGADLDVSTSDTRTIAQAISDGAVTDYSIKNCIAYVENTSTASQNIPAGAYVIWQNNDYTAISNITAGDTLSSANLSVLLDGGIANSINDKISPIGNFYTGVWNASVSNAINTQLTTQLTLPAGNYLLMIAFPVCSVQNLPYNVYISDPTAAATLIPLIENGGTHFETVCSFYTRTNINVYLQSSFSVNCTYSNLERGAIRAIRIK